MRFVKWRGGAECGGWLAIARQLGGGWAWHR